MTSIMRPARRAAAAFALLALVALLAAGCGAGTGAGASGRAGTGGGSTITIKTFGYSPATLHVRPGQKVEVVNETSVTHTVTARDHRFNTGDVKGHTRTSFTAPTKPGLYPYFCEIHQYMTGTLVVTRAAATTGR
jgi:plastocyanin